MGSASFNSDYVCQQYRVLYSARPEGDITRIGYPIEKSLYRIDASSLVSQVKLTLNEMEILKRFYNAKNPSPQLRAFAFSIIVLKQVYYFPETDEKVESNH